eukprot:CAMPEP_0202689286 /NCGR_PEP_ID=MMETSP1385-20130828/4584_1 /ASSEMBLY_ACC=CAM_ASM_000861 /TAXON_ID=933848 /ORGANISM="Elphidium margaritaceum" /LENGTH=152 /DNA_ID=CAMNT_0049344401 /DNA_START=43 /DNA_END=501 /DNA_ORIENTATION=-
MAQKQEFDTTDGRLIYDSEERGGFYNCIRCLWCACCEPYHRITTKYVKVTKWEGCTQTTDSMAMEAISDLTREQSCCCCLASCCCGCCIHDFGTLTLYGNDRSNANGETVLVNVAHSEQVSDSLATHLQEIHKDFRQNGKNLATKLNEIKNQ